MKIALITDLHFGKSNDNKFYLKKQKEFFQNQFFPYIKKHEVKRVFCLGDIFDKRKTVNIETLKEVKEFFFDYMLQNDIEFKSILGNHDIYFNNTSEVSIIPLLKEYPNVTIYKHHTVYPCGDDFNIGFLAWINDSNIKETEEFFKRDDINLLLGHLEICGFKMSKHNQHTIEEGYNESFFKKYENVFSGHLHLKSTSNNITYLGTPYELTWLDFNSLVGFHIFNTDTRELQHIQNKENLFCKVVYDNGNVTSFPEHSSLEDKMVKVIIKNNDDGLKWRLFCEELEEKNATVTILQDSEIDTIDLKTLKELEKKENIDMLEIFNEVIMSSSPNLNHKDKIIRELTNLYENVISDNTTEENL